MYNDFDGNGAVLAHAFFPKGNECIELHLDSDENWYRGTDETPIGSVSLYWTLMHEIGHSLGLAHSSVRDSIMFPFYSDGRKVTLSQDDINGIQTFYGKPPTKNIVTTTTTTMTPEIETSTSKSLDAVKPPDLCRIKNKIQKFFVMKKNLYIFHELCYGLFL